MIKTALTTLVAALIFASASGATTPPTKTLSQIELRAHIKNNTKTTQINRVVCQKTGVKNTYLCKYFGIFKGKKACAADYVHYATNRPHFLDHWRPAWGCNSKPPIPVGSLPVYPTDQPPVA